MTTKTGSMCSIQYETIFSLQVRWLAGALSILLAAAPAAAQAPDDSPGPAAAAGVRNHVFEVRLTSSDMRVDARLDESAWRDATVIPLPLEITPRDNVPADLRTECRVTFDDANVYLGCMAHDPDPSSIRAYITNRDGIFGNNDRISFLLDPFNDSRRGFVFEVSPLGVQADLVYDERITDFDESWDGIWDSAGRITEDGYVIEAAIPFQTLRFPDTDGIQTWRFWIYRMRPRSEFVVLSTNTRLRDEACRLCQAQLLRGFQGMAPGLNLELVPTLTGRRSDSRAETFPDGPLVNGGVEFDPGLDARWSITPNLTLNGTVNPDFSQVEADAPQLDANTRFALRFPEKRPFFLEGADLFRTPLEVVFTRRIADPSGGAKLTGKTGPHAIGILAAVDEVNNLLLPGPFGSTAMRLNERVASTVLRYRRDLGENHTVGAVYTGRFGENDYRNQVAGVDVFLQPGSRFTWTTQLLASRTRYGLETAEAFDQTDGAFGGQALVTSLQYGDRVWGAMATTHIRTADFRADAGFVPQTDLRNKETWGSHTYWGSGTVVRRLETSTGVWHNDRTNGDLLSKGAWLNLYYEGPMQSEAWFNPVRSQEVFAGEAHDLLGFWSGFSLRPLRWLRVGISGNAGDQIDFRNGGRGDVLRLSPSLDAQIGRRGEIGASHSFQRLDKGGAHVFTANVGELRAVYNFSARTFVRATLQYRRTTRNPATNPGLEQPLEEALFTQLLFSYEVNPLTVLFLGLTDDRAGFEDGTRRVELTPRGRTFFLKLGYAWRP